MTESDYGSRADEIDPKKLDAVNEKLMAEMVHAGKMPVQVLDHLGHLKHDVYSLGCTYCTSKGKKP